MPAPRLTAIASAGLLALALTAGGVAGPAGAATTSRSAVADHPNPEPKHKTKRGGTAGAPDVARGAPLKCIQVRCHTATDRAKGKVTVEHQRLRSRPPRPHYGKRRVHAPGHEAGKSMGSAHAVEKLRTHR